MAAALPETLDAVTRAIGKLGWKVVDVDSRKGWLKAKTPASLRSWGEEIHVHLASNKGHTQVVLSSEASAQLFDWGRGRENLTALRAELSHALPGRTA